MAFTKQEQGHILHSLLFLGEQLLGAGAEIARVEETMERIGLAYGAERMDVFVITSSIVVTAEFPDTHPLTETRRIRSGGGNDFTRLERLNELSRRCCAQPMPPEAFDAELLAISACSTPFSRVVLGGVLAAGGFAVFFGGTLADAAVAAVFAVVICYLQRFLGGTQLNTVASNLLVSLLVGTMVGVVCHIFYRLHMDAILIGDIMLLIPGIAMTNAVQNILLGNTISGIMRLTETLIWAAALAGGFMVSLWFTNIML